MLYVILGRDGPGALPIRRRVRPQHLDRVRALASEGRVVLAGPLPTVDATDPGESGFAGSLIVAEFASLAEARAWAEQDPYTTEGVFASLSVEPFVRVLP